MTKLNFLRRILLAAVVMAQGFMSVSALASGSIVINGPATKRLSYEDAGQTRELEMTLTDIEVSAAVKTWLDQRYGKNRGEYPYMFDKQSGTVTILVDRLTAKYEIVPLSQLK